VPTGFRVQGFGFMYVCTLNHHTRPRTGSLPCVSCGTRSLLTLTRSLLTHICLLYVSCVICFRKKMISSCTPCATTPNFRWTSFFWTLVHNIFLTPFYFRYSVCDHTDLIEFPAFDLSWDYEVHDTFLCPFHLSGKNIK